MFKKDGSDTSAPQPRPTQTPGGRTPPPRKGGGPAMIGPSITIKGDVSGDEGARAEQDDDVIDADYTEEKGDS